jgi:NTE family protein
MATARLRAWPGLLAIALCASALAQTDTPPPTSPPTPQPTRPRIGLVLSGGGARGLSHVGVLKVLERERIPVDVIAGTSMGAIIGGLYASGMDADTLERELLKVNWDAVFANRVDRQLLSQRRKEEDFEISPLIEFGMRDGELRAPLGALSGRGLETLLRRYTLPVRSVRDFDRLPIPFRAVATDMEDGRAVILRQGDLALALRSSMSVPGVFPPTEIDDRILGDGGLVDNVPVDVARAMGADIVIAVNIGTPLAPRKTLGSVGGLTGQMINILTEQNVQRSLASLGGRDLLISPQLGEISSGDFNKTRELIALGEQGAAQLAARLAALSLDETAYAQWKAGHPREAPPQATLAFVEFEGSGLTNPKRFAAQMESTAGQPFDAAKAERDARRLAASGDYVRADYELVSTDRGDGLVFDLEDKPWGPHYFRVGLDLNTDFTGRSAFNLKISHNRHWLDANGTEWRNRVQIGEVPRLFSELYHPLNWTLGISNDWFVAGYGEAERRKLAVYNGATGDERGHFNRSTGRFGIDLGQPWGQFGELRIGLTHLTLRNEPEILSSDYSGPRETVTIDESGLRVGVVVDQLDFANFPLHGYRLQGEVVSGRRSDSVTGSDSDRFTRVETEGSAVGTWGRHTLNALVRVQHADQRSIAGLGRYTLGGFQQMSGYLPGQIEGNYLAFGRLAYYQRLDYAPVFTRGLFVGGSLEAGNAWDFSSQMKLNDLRSGMSLFVGADTGIGPLYLGVTYAPRGAAGLYLFIGRP